LLRYRSKTAKMQKFPIDSYSVFLYFIITAALCVLINNKWNSNENFIFPFSVRWGPTPILSRDGKMLGLSPDIKIVILSNSAHSTFVLSTIDWCLLSLTFSTLGSHRM